MKRLSGYIFLVSFLKINAGQFKPTKTIYTKDGIKIAQETLYKSDLCEFSHTLIKDKLVTITTHTNKQITESCTKERTTQTKVVACLIYRNFINALEHARIKSLKIYVDVISDTKKTE